MVGHRTTGDIRGDRRGRGWWVKGTDWEGSRAEDGVGICAGASAPTSSGFLRRRGTYVRRGVVGWSWWAEERRAGRLFNARCERFVVSTGRKEGSRWERTRQGHFEDNLALLVLLECLVRPFCEEG